MHSFFVFFFLHFHEAPTMVGLNMFQIVYECTLCKQARKQFETLVGAKSFLIGARIFETMSNSFKTCPTHFSRGAKNFLGNIPLVPLWLWASL